MLAKILIRKISKRNYCNFHVRRRNRRIYIAKTIVKIKKKNAINKKTKTKHTRNPNANKSL